MYAGSVAVTRALRNLIHFKPSGGQDYIVAFDSAATSSAKIISQNLFFDKTNGEASVMTDNTLPSLVWTGSNRRLSTQVVLPSGTAVASTSGSGVTAFRHTPCTSTDGVNCATATSAEFLIVHRPSTSITDAMPTVAAIGTIDSDFSGVQIEDASNPAVAVFAEAGVDQATGSFTTTHSGTAKYVVVGLVAGAYDVTRGVTSVLDDEVVDTNGVLSFSSVAGAFTIQEGTAPPPSVEITTTSLPNHVEDVAGYAQTLQYTGGTGTINWTITAGSLCTGLSLNAGTGAITGTPTTQQTCTFTVQAEDDLNQTDTQELSITITAPPPTCVVTTTSLSNGTRNEAYAEVLASSGCTAPLSWTITGGALCTGLSLTEATGGIAGTPTIVETCNFTVRVEDDDAEVDTEVLSITVDPPAPAVLNINTISPLPTCTQHQACSTTFEATGGTPPYAWTVTSGALCTGQSLVEATGVLSGTPTVVQTCTFTVQVEDDDSTTDSQSFQRSIVAQAPNLTVQAIPGSQGVIVKFSGANLGGSEVCNVNISDEELDDDTGLPIGPVGNAVSSSGRSTRVVTIGALTEEHRHTASVVCGTVANGSTSFVTTEAVGGIINWKYTKIPPPYLATAGAAKLRVVAVPGSGDTSLNTGITHHWSMDETSGNREDTINPGSTNAWAPTGSPSYSAGRNGNAVSVTPSAYLTLATSTVFPSTTFTVSFWIYVNSYTDALGAGSAIFTSSTESAGIDIYKAESDTDIIYKTWPTGAAALEVNPITTGAWHNVIAWFDDASNEGGIQVDGGTPELISGGNFVRTSGNMFFPFNNPASGFTGLIDEVTLWDGRVLTEAERDAVADSTYYPFGTLTVTDPDCASGCTVNLPLDSGEVYTIYHQWLTSGGSVLSTTQAVPVVVP